MAERHCDQSDLLSLPQAQLQSALLKVQDEQLLQALPAARREVRSCLLNALSTRRRQQIGAELLRREESGSRSDRSSAVALRSLLERVFRLEPPQSEAARASSSAGRDRALAGEGALAPAQLKHNGPDLTPAALGLLKEARGIVDALPLLGGSAAHVRRCRTGMAGAVLLKAWTERPPAVPRETIYRNLCSPPAKSVRKHA